MAYTVVAQNKEHLKKLIEQTIKEKGNYCDLNFIDVSNVTNMSYMFHNSQFNGDISKWNVSNVTNMNNMFSYSESNDSEFNEDISGFDLSITTNEDSLFSFSKFNGDISEWNVSNVTKHYNAFNGCPIKDAHRPKFPTNK